MGDILQTDEHPLAKWREEIRAFSSLAKGWDSYNAEPPSEMAIQSALSVLDHLGSIGVHPDWIIPTSDDSILLQFSHDDLTYQWELESDGDVGVMIKPQEGEPEYLDLTADQIADFFAERCHGSL